MPKFMIIYIWCCQKSYVSIGDVQNLNPHSSIINYWIILSKKKKNIELSKTKKELYIQGLSYVLINTFFLIGKFLNLEKDQEIACRNLKLYT